MNKPAQDRDLIIHYVALAVGLMLSIVGAYLGYLATTSLSWREIPPGHEQVRASWMCIVPGVTCVLVGGRVLLTIYRARWVSG